MTTIKSPEWKLRDRESCVQEPTADLVAAVILGISTIGAACEALSAAGWRATLAGNRITVNDRVFVRYIYETAGPDRPYDTRWVVYGIGDRPIVRIVVAGDAQTG